MCAWETLNEITIKFNSRKIGSNASHEIYNDMKDVDRSTNICKCDFRQGFEQNLRYSQTTIWDTDRLFISLLRHFDQYLTKMRVNCCNSQSTYFCVTSNFSRFIWLAVAWQLLYIDFMSHQSVYFSCFYDS